MRGILLQSFFLVAANGFDESPGTPTDLDAVLSKGLRVRSISHPFMRLRVTSKRPPKVTKWWGLIRGG